MSSRASSAPTIIDVAREAGVSIKTVSRVLNREAGVHEQTREQVLAVVAQLKYRPKLSARSLAGARSFLIGLLYYDPSAAFVGGVQKGAAVRCREAGYHLVVESIENEAPDIETQVDRMVAALRPDGMILTPPLCDNPQVLKVLSDSGTPTVLISPGDHDPALLTVRMDDVHAAQEVTQLLIELGHERIGFIRGARDQAASELRYQGFKLAMEAAGLSVDEALVYQGDFTFPSGVAGAHHLLGQKGRPTAVFASNDDMALGVLSAAQRLGLQVPGELSIAGFDDSPAASLVWPPLTTVRQPIEEMARVAVDMLVTPAAGGDEATPGGRVLPHRLVPRDSTAALASRAHRPTAARR
ncbi:LacI family DNA-binding transcriptional regulator [Ideonella sp. DXS29W]|uniref:LacI family DNA-binding transcriptional regulator n=1 Tax=Ideonella lacteola TaxID=2984193 RepID=A0ABU9BT12_9BURK